MKKILFALLIAVIFCKTELDYVSQDFTDVLDMAWESVKNTFDSAVEFLRIHNLYDQLMLFIKANSEKVAVLFCKKKFSEDTCKSILDFLKDLVKNTKA